MHELKLGRKAASRLLHQSNNDIERALAPNNNASQPASQAQNPPASISTRPKPKKKSKERDAPTTNDIADMLSELSLLAPILQSAKPHPIKPTRELKTRPAHSKSKCLTKLSFYAYSRSMLPRCLSVLPNPPPKSQPAPPTSYGAVAPLSQTAPYSLIQQYITRNPVEDVHLMFCTSEEDAERCLKGYKASYVGRKMKVLGKDKKKAGGVCVVKELGGMWGFEVFVKQEVLRKVVGERELIVEDEEEVTRIFVRSKKDGAKVEKKEG